jgi:hypothetical protein
MLERVTEFGEGKIDFFCSAHDIESLQSVYLGLTDEKFQRDLRSDSGVSTPEVKELMQQIEDRQLWRRILDQTTALKANSILLALRSEFPDLASKINCDEKKPGALKDLQSGAARLIRNGEGVYEAGYTGPWTRASSIIEALEKADESSVRIYFDGTDKHAAKRIRDRALQLAFEQRESGNGTP